MAKNSTPNQCSTNAGVLSDRVWDAVLLSTAPMPFLKTKGYASVHTAQDPSQNIIDIVGATFIITTINRISLCLDAHHGLDYLYVAAR